MTDPRENLYNFLRQRGVIKTANSYQERNTLAELSEPESREPFSVWLSRLSYEDRRDFLYAFGNNVGDN